MCINISFINIKTCDALIVKEQRRGVGGGEENTKTSYIHNHFGEKIQKLYIHTYNHSFFFGGGGGEEKKR